MNKTSGSSLFRRRISRRAALNRGLIGIAGVVAVPLVGCSDDDDGEGTDAQASPASTTAASATSQVPSSSANVKRGGVVRGAVTADIPHFDLQQGSGPSEMGLVYDGVVQFDPFELYTIRGGLAHDWEFSDPLTLVFHLHEATFHDGTPFTSEDIAVSLERIINKDGSIVSRNQALFAAIERIETPDERTAVVRLSRPSASLFDGFCSLYSPVYSARDILDGGFDHKEKMNGTGPYLLDRYDRGTRLTYKRNPNYFEPDDVPYIDGVEYYIISEAVSQLAAFKGGELDMLVTSTSQLAEVEQMSGATILEASGPSFYSTTIATWKEPWTDPRVWKAVGLAINKQDAAQLITQGRGPVGAMTPRDTMWSLSEEDLLRVPGYKGLGDGAESDMDQRRVEARKLLEATGVLGTRVALTGGAGGSFENWSLVFLDGLQQAGLEVDMELLEQGDFDERQFAKNYGDMAANTRSGGGGGADPSAYFAANYITGAGRHYTGLVIEEVDALYERQEEALDLDERIPLVHELQKKYLEVYPAEVAAWTYRSLALRDYVQGYGVLYGALAASRRLQWLWLDK